MILRRLLGFCWFCLPLMGVAVALCCGVVGCGYLYALDLCCMDVLSWLRLCFDVCILCFGYFVWSIVHCEFGF